MVGAFAAAASEEVAQQGRRLGLEHAADGGGAVQGEPVTGQVPHRAAGAELVVPGAENDALDPREQTFNRFSHRYGDPEVTDYKFWVNASVPLDCLAYKFDIVLRGRRSTLFENRLEGN